jgi:hypothetical protein
MVRRFSIALCITRSLRQIVRVIEPMDAGEDFSDATVG